MHEGRLHVTPETGTAAFVPSNVYLDGASLTSSGVSTGLMGAGLVAFMAPNFLASLALPFGLQVPPAFAGPTCDRTLIIAAFLFSLLGLGLGTINLVLGLRLRARCHDLSERAEHLLFANPETRAMLVGLGAPLHADDGPAAVTPGPAAPVTGGGHEHEHEHGHSREEEHEHPRERPNPNNAPAGA